MSNRRPLAIVLGIALLSLCWNTVSHAQDPVATMAADVEMQNVRNIIQTLEGFGTRYSFTTECDEAADWLFATLEGFGVEVSNEEFDVSGSTLRNVIGRHEGVLNPDNVVIVGAHYDSMSETPWDFAPGADDNASGVAAVLEAARILSGYSFENTVEFICYGGEEQGRKGSEHNALQAGLTGKNIVGMINLDMIGYWPPGSDQELDIGKNVSSSWLAELAENATTDYSSIPVHNWPDTGVCFDDQVSYWAEGYDAIVLMDCYEAHLDPGGSGETTPHYHRTTDTFATLNLPLTTEAVRATVAATAILAAPFVAPIQLQLAKLPGTSDLQVSWIGGAPPFVVQACALKDFTSGVIELTPPGGTGDADCLHEGTLDDGQDYFYRLTGP